VIEKQNRKLVGGIKTAYEALEIADDTSNRLASQTEILTRGGERVILLQFVVIEQLRNVNGMLDESRGLIKDMQNTIMKNKMRMYGVFGLIGLAVTFIVGSYFF
jgi:hypothetical protein